jgi:hypothetical protein
MLWTMNDRHLIVCANLMYLLYQPDLYNIWTINFWTRPELPAVNSQKLWKEGYDKVLRKIRRLGGENGQFRHNRASNAWLGMKFYKTKLLGPKLVFPLILVVNWVSSPLSFFLIACTAAAYIFSTPTSTITIITLESCALNAEFQHFILRFNKISLLCRYHWKRG